MFKHELRRSIFMFLSTCRISSVASAGVVCTLSRLGTSYVYVRAIVFNSQAHRQVVTSLATLRLNTIVWILRNAYC